MWIKLIFTLFDHCIICGNIEHMTKITTQDQKIEDVVRRHVVDVFREFLSDPDAGLLLRQDFVRHLKKSVNAKRDGRHRDLREVLKKYN